MQPIPPSEEPIFAEGPTPPDVAQVNGLRVDAWPIGNGWQTWQPVDKSQVVQDFQKWASMPTGLEEIEGYQARLDGNGDEEVRYWQCPWSQVAAAKQWFYGYSYIQTDSVLNTGGNAQPTYHIRRVIPAQDPYRPWLYCETCEVVQGKGAWVIDPENYIRDIGGNYLDQDGNILGQLQPDPDAAFHNVIMPAKVYVDQVGQENFEDGWAVLRVRYRPRPYPVRNDTQAEAHPLTERSRFVSVRREYAIQSLPLYRITVAGGAAQKLLFTAGDFVGKQVPEPGVLLMPTQRLIVTLHDWPLDPDPAIQAAMGKLNIGDFQPAPGWPVYPSGTLLLSAPTARIVGRNGCGAVSYTIELPMDFRQQGWNAFPDPLGNFNLATFGGGPGDPTVFHYGSFEDLFKPGPPTVW